jgi:hypothetical protein
MNRLPRRVPVKAGWYKVKQVPRADPHLLDCVGRCVDEQSCIYILKTMSLEQKWATLCHEWAHGIADGHQDLNICTSEDAVEHVGQRVLSLLRHLVKE